MAEVESELDGGVVITLSSGTKVRLAPLVSPPNITVKDIRNLSGALIDLAKDFDDRLAKLEKK